MDYFNNILEIVGQTPMVKINRLFSEFDGVTVLAKLEYLNPGGSMKDRVAIKMIERAEEAGLIKPGDTLVEPTSGNTGIGLAQAAAVKGYRMVITMPEKMSEEKRRLLRSYGAELILTPTELAFDHPDNYIEVAKRMAAEDPNTHILNQYDNEGNPAAHYEGTGPEIWEQTKGKLDYFVCGMGTGGTITGIGHYLKDQNPDVGIIGIDPEGSIFSGGESKPYEVEGIGYDFFPKIFDTKVVDTMYRVNDTDSFSEARRMAKEEGIFAGGSTGTVIAGVRRLLNDLKEKGGLDGKVIVMMVHDNGRSYLSKIFNDDWMEERGFLKNSKAAAA